MKEKIKKVKRRRRFFRPKPEYLMRRLSGKKVLRVDDVSIILGNHIKNVYELVRRGRLKPISNKLPYLFEASIVKGFIRQKPGRKPKEKPAKKLKRFVSKRKSTMGGGDSFVEVRVDGDFERRRRCPDRRKPLR